MSHCCSLEFYKVPTMRDMRYREIQGDRESKGIIHLPRLANTDSDKALSAKPLYGEWHTVCDIAQRSKRLK